MVYDIKGNSNYTLLPDILRRVKLRTGLSSSRFVFDKYNVKENEKPEDVAFKYYGDPKLHWVILMTNNVTDRYYQWPMTQPQFAEFLTDKYGAGNEDSVHHYEITQASGRSTGQGPDDYSHKVEVNSDEDYFTGMPSDSSESDDEGESDEEANEKAVEDHSIKDIDIDDI